MRVEEVVVNMCQRNFPSSFLAGPLVKVLTCEKD